MSIKENNALMIKTIFTQEMLKKGFLASNIIYVSYAHTKDIVDIYLKEADEVFGVISSALKKGTLEKLLESPVCHSGFKRLT
jgi:glutamate-1-semialdehyde aminotransferase